jgi:hypothetical protein
VETIFFAQLKKRCIVFCHGYINPPGFRQV